MQNRLTSRKRPEAAASPDSRNNRGNTVPAQDEQEQPAPRTPNERDASADSQGSQEPSGQRIGKQAHADLKRGLVDTGRSPQLDQTYDKVRGGDDVKDPVRK